MKFSVWPNPARPVSEILELARLADSEGWYGLWYADHYMPNTGSEAFAPGDTHECWAILPAVGLALVLYLTWRAVDAPEPTADVSRSGVTIGA